MKKITFLFLFLLFAGTHALLAQRTIRGTVTSAEDNDGIPGVQVQAKGTILGTTTDIMGQYTIAIPEDVTALIFSFMGMASQEIEIGSKTTIDVVMQSDATAIEGVEIVSYGTARKVGTTVGSVQQVSAAQLQGRANANILDALQGQVAGLQVFSNSGDPNETQTLRLHGLGSLTSSSTPLYVVDGIQIDATTVLAMNPNDFESVTVLKDASATSIYGSRAANGVIVITTRRGTRNTDARITFRSSYGFSSVADKSYFDQLMTSGELLAFREAVGGDPLWAPESVALIREQYNTSTNTDWIDVYMRGNAPVVQNDLSIAGGGGKTTYFLSAGQFSQEGTAYGSSFDRYTVRANIESQAKNWLKVGVNTLLSRSKRSSNAAGDWNSGTIKFAEFPWYSPMDEQGNRYDLIPTVGGNALPHPAYAAANRKSLTDVSTLTGSFFLEITPLKGLKFISRSGTNAMLSESDRYMMPSYAVATGEINGGTRQVSSGTGITMTTNNVVEYSFKIQDKHAITALVGQEGILTNSKTQSVGVQALTDDRQMLLTNGTEVRSQIGSTLGSSAFLSFFGRLDYSFDDRFYADFSLRNDASSRFGSKNRNAQFWSMGGMWNMTNEKFIKNTGFITDAKLKVSYGTQGNSNIGDYTHLALVGRTPMYEDQLSWTLSSPGNSLLTWETQKKFTAGFRVEILKKYRVELDFYNRTTADMLMARPMPNTAGFPSITMNVGSLQNRGIDLNLGVDIIRGKDYYLSANVVFNYNVDKILELYDGLTEYAPTSTGPTQYVVGESIMLYYPMYGGVNPNNGKQWWYLPGQDRFATQQNGDSITEVFSDVALRQNTGYRRYAPITGGFGIQAGWKGFSLVADFSFVQGRYMIDANWQALHNAMNTLAGRINYSRDVLDYWKQPGDVTEFPDWTQGQLLYSDSRALSNASFMRLKNLALSYSFDKKRLAKTKVLNTARIFVSARNLWLITPFKGIDPEVDAASAGTTYMNSKQFQFGIELGF